MTLELGEHLLLVHGCPSRSSPVERHGNGIAGRLGWTSERAIDRLGGG